MQARVPVSAGRGYAEEREMMKKKWKVLLMVTFPFWVPLLFVWMVYAILWEILSEWELVMPWDK